MDPTFIYLVGAPGTGKYTVAREIAARTGARLVDNHSIINVIFNLVAPDGIRPLPAGIWGPVRHVRAAVIETLLTVAPKHLSYVFTIYHRGEDEGELAAFDEVVAVADARGSVFVPVLLSCSTEELVKRVVAEDRRERMKLINAELAADWNDNVPPFRTNHPNALQLDISHMAPPEAAETIIAHARGCASTAR